MEYLTTAQAAQRARVSRPTISRALKSAELPGIRDNSGAWRIEPEKVDAWARQRLSIHLEQCANRVQIPKKDAHDAQLEQARADLSSAREQIARLEGQATAHADRLADAVADRDAWKAIAERLSPRPVEAVQPVLPVQRNLLARLFRR